MTTAVDAAGELTEQERLLNSLCRKYPFNIDITFHVNRRRVVCSEKEQRFIEKSLSHDIQGALMHSFEKFTTVEADSKVCFVEKTDGRRAMEATETMVRSRELWRYGRFRYRGTGSCVSYF